jgi:pyruvate/2-oxoacid:ferredoxin oxidoreductase alpha subunit
MTVELLEGSDAIARAMVAAGCRFFSGYPMTPFTEVFERMGTYLPERDGVCMNAESELEAVGMAWGAAATGVRASTGSTGQGLALMGESISEMTLAIVGGVGLGTLSSTIHPYPTQADVFKRAGDAWSRTRLTPRTQAILRWVLARRR